MLSEQDRTLIRHFLGFGALWNQADPRLEAAMTAAQSQAEGGSRPDSNGENLIKSYVYGSAAQCGNPVTLGPTTQNIPFTIPATQGLLAIEQLLSSMWGMTFAVGKQDEATLNPAKGMIQLRIEGQRLAFALARTLGMKRPRADIFFPDTGGIADSEDPFWGNSSPIW